jgi:hypothetical protein
MQAYEHHRRAEAPIATVFAVLTDADGWSDWTRIGHTGRERDGVEVADGIGAVRSFRTGPITSREEVVAYSAPDDGAARFGYRLLSGLPVADYEADVRLATRDGGTDIVWSADFAPRWAVTARPMAVFLRRTVAQIADALVTESEQRASRG